MDPPVTMSIDVIIIANLIVDNNSLVHFVFFSKQNKKTTKNQEYHQKSFGLD